MSLLRIIDRLWTGLLWGLMAIAALYVGFIMLAIVYMTIFRTAGWDYFQRANTLIEYGFIYIMFLGSPWLIRTKAHVYIELLTAAVPPGVRNVISRSIAVICTMICLVWAWYTWNIFLEHAENSMAFDELRAEMGFRSWVWSISFPFGFAAMAIEFARFIFAREPMHSGDAGVASERIELEETTRSLKEAR